VQVRLGDVEHADLELLIALGVVDQIVQATPGAFQLLEILVVDDLVDLGGELGVDGGDDRFNRLDRVVGHQVSLRQGLFGQGTHGGFHGFAGTLGLGFELLQQQVRELAGFFGGAQDLGAFAGGIVSHDYWSPAGLGALASACSSAGSLIAFMMISSAPVLPSM